MVNALLGVVQADAVMADSVSLDEDARHKAWQEQLGGRGRAGRPVQRVEFIRWQVQQAV
jgi:hypothetical protein